MAKVGRNDPCPCGSGKKHKRCCGADSSMAADGGAAAASPLAGRGAMERAMAEVGRRLADREFGSIEDLNAYLERAMSDPVREPPPPRSPLERAQDLVYQAWEASGKRRARLAREALALSPDCADAYSLLADETAGSLEGASGLYAQAVEAGERALRGRRLDPAAGDAWGRLEARPLIRALAGLASCRWQEGRHREAIAHWEQILRLNPNDNQGARYALLAGLLEEGEDAPAEALLKRYPGDAAASWAYGRALLAYRKGGDTAQAKRARTRALATNPHVPAYLTGQKRPPRSLPGYVGLGDESEAVVCAAEQVAAWQGTPGALAWLAGAAPDGGRATPVRADAVYQLKVTLRGSRPPIWRRLLVRADTRLSTLHAILQVAMGWTDDHLHQFEAGARRIGVPRRGGWAEVEDERRVRLSEVAPGERARLTYEYDFGDSWEHQIVVEKVGSAERGAVYPVCLAGRRAGPPEDVGGVWRYGWFVEAIRDPAHPEHDELLEWVGGAFDPEAFDREAINAALRRLR
jgi:tetratricopeptide (TPR) repeat protein